MEPRWSSELDRTSLLVNITGLDFCCDVAAVSVIWKERVRIQFESHVALPSNQAVCLLRFSVARDEDGFILFEQHCPVGRGDLLRAKELCCGFGALGFGAERVGFGTAACNDIRAEQHVAGPASSLAGPPGLRMCIARRCCGTPLGSRTRGVLRHIKFFMSTL